MSRAEAVELYGAPGCPYTAELREHLIWEGVPFAEYDVEADAQAHARLCELTGGVPVVPVLVSDGRITESGWRGRSCAVGRGR